MQSNQNVLIIIVKTRDAQTDVAETNKIIFCAVLTLLLMGFRTNDYSGGGSLGPRSYFQLILTSFWTHGTIIDQFIVKGVHQ